MRKPFILALLLACLAATGCDKSGIHALGRTRDTLGPCQGPTETWLRATPEGTEIFLIGEATVATDGTPVPGCFARALVENNSSTNLEYGSYTGTATEGTFSYAAEYDFRYQPERGILSRDGAERIEHDPPITVPIELEVDGDELVLTYQTEERRLVNILDVIDALDVDTMEGALDVMRMYNLPLFTSQVRMLGFGSSGMTQYLDNEQAFAGTIANTFSVVVREVLNPKTYITYNAFEDLTGIVHEGQQRTYVNLSGDGTMEGTVDFTMEGRTRTIRGTIDYMNLTIDNGVAGGGTYGLTIEDGGSFDVTYEVAADTCPRSLLP